MNKELRQLRYQVRINYDLQQIVINRSLWLLRSVIRGLWFLAGESAVSTQTREERLIEMFKIICEKKEK